MTKLLTELLDWLIPRPTFRRYRVLPERKASAFRRETLACVVQALKRHAPRSK